MSTQAPGLDEIQARIARQERRRLLRTVLAVAVPVAVAVAYLLYTLDAIDQAETDLHATRVALVAATAEVESKRRAVAALEAQVASLETQLADVSARLSEAVGMRNQILEFDWAEAKFLASQSERLAKLVFVINDLHQRGVGWGFENTPEDGFTSPGLAGYALQKIGRLPDDLEPAHALAQLPVEQGEAELGDLIFYEPSYYLFYLRDQDGQPFVLGMTPFGILPLQVDFGPERRGILRTGLAQ